MKPMVGSPSYNVPCLKSCEGKAIYFVNSDGLGTEEEAQGVELLGASILVNDVSVKAPQIKSLFGIRLDDRAHIHNKVLTMG